MKKFQKLFIASGACFTLWLLGRSAGADIAILNLGFWISGIMGLYYWGKKE